MGQVTFYFSGEANTLLPINKREIEFIHEFKDNPSIKDTIESLGVPHTEVNAIIVNEKSEDFSYLLQDGDNCKIYSFFSTPKNQEIIELQPPIPENISFILDVHLGKLASFLRMLGFDTLYNNTYEDAEIADISDSENRIVLTRDKGLLMRKKVIYGYYVRATNPKKQLKEILKRFDIFKKIKPFKRCIKCNGDLEYIDKQSIIEALPEATKKYINKFHRCTDCSQIYWPGSHHKDMQQFISEMVGITESQSNFKLV